jgi:hypothetical protein
MPYSEAVALKGETMVATVSTDRDALARSCAEKAASERDEVIARTWASMARSWQHLAEIERINNDEPPQRHLSIVPPLKEKD